MTQKLTTTMTVEEKSYAHTLLSLSRTPIIMGGLLWIAAMFIPVLHGNSDKIVVWSYVSYFLIVSLGIATMIVLNWWPFRHVHEDFRMNNKIIEKTIVTRLKKVGFFEMNADSALGIMAGAIYYLWVPDEARSPPHRRFRIGLTTYRQLMLYGNGPIDIAYLPKSGMILSIDTTDYRYAAWEPSDKRHQYKSEHV